MRLALASTVAVCCWFGVEARAERRERSSFAVFYAYQPALDAPHWWLPNGAQSRFRLPRRLELEIQTTAFKTAVMERTDAPASASQRTLMSSSAGLLVHVTHVAYAVAGGGVAYDWRYVRSGSGADWSHEGGSWHGQAFIGAGARWQLSPLVTGAAPPCIGIDVRGLALSPGAAPMSDVPSLPRVSVQASILLGVVL